MKNSHDEKIFIVQQTVDGEYETESIWCIKDGDNFIIDNIPFVAKRISLGDTIKAEYDKEDTVYYFDDFVEVSGNTTVRLYFDVTNKIEETRMKLAQYGCESEVFLGRKLIAVNVPKDIDYKPIKKYLDDGEKNKQWVYEESCLAHEY